MTLPRHRIGDKGQRFELQAEGWPADGWNVIGWDDDRSRLEMRGVAIRHAPSCTDVRIIDRHTQEAVGRDHDAG
ncbi:MAG: hypothetical protein AAFR84_21880 [Pseudomonadota bacterium]